MARIETAANYVAIELTNNYLEMFEMH